jgi:MFS family permease
MSLYMLVFTGGTPIGGPVIGAITDRWGAPLAVLLCGAVCLLATIACALLAARQTGVRLQVDLRRRAERHLVLVHREA